MADQPNPKQAASCERQLHPVELAELVPGLRNHDGTPITKATVRLHLTSELELALRASAAHVSATAPESPTAKARYEASEEVNQNTLAAEAIYHAFRVHDDEKYPLFISSDWIRKNLTAQTLGQLANVYEMCEARETPSPWPDLDPEWVETTRALVTSNIDNLTPEALLEPYVLAEHGRRFLVQAIAFMCLAWTQERMRYRETLEAIAAAEGPGDMLDAATETLAELPE